VCGCGVWGVCLVLEWGVWEVGLGRGLCFGVLLVGFSFCGVARGFFCGVWFFGWWSGVGFYFCGWGLVGGFRGGVFLFGGGWMSLCPGCFWGRVVGLWGGGGGWAVVRGCVVGRCCVWGVWWIWVGAEGGCFLGVLIGVGCVGVGLGGWWGLGFWCEVVGRVGGVVVGAGGGCLGGCVWGVGGLLVSVSAGATPRRLLLRREP